MSNILVHLKSDPSKVLLVDAVHYDSVLLKTGKYELVPQRTPVQKPSWKDRLLKLFMEL